MNVARYDSPGGVSNPMPGLQGVDRAQTAPGSEGVRPEATAGAVVGSVMPRSVMYAPSTPIAEVQVLSGDTCAFSDDRPIHQSDLLPQATAASSTGAGDGRVRGPSHPNSEFGAGPEV